MVGADEFRPVGGSRRIDYGDSRRSDAELIEVLANGLGMTQQDDGGEPLVTDAAGCFEYAPVARFGQYDGPVQQGRFAAQTFHELHEWCPLSVPDESSRQSYCRRKDSQRPTAGFVCNLAY